MAEAEQAGWLLRLGEAQRFRLSPQVSTQPRGLGLLRPRLPRKARRARAGGAPAEGRRPRGEQGGQLARVRARASGERGEGRMCACARGVQVLGPLFRRPSSFCACARPCRPLWRPRALTASSVFRPLVVLVSLVPPCCPFTSFPPA